VDDDLIDERPDLSLRPSTPDDRDFLRAVHASTREEELRLVPWSDADKAGFVSMQFDAQDSAYRTTYPDGRFLLVMEGDEPIGRLYVARLPDQIRVIDIALLPDHRGRGIGTRLLRDVIEEATAAGLPVRLHVERSNRAQNLYERLGFRAAGGDDVYEALEWWPRSGAPVS
jgi:ribosomal protein S18 acetylase RimI-like enzyme